MIPVALALPVFLLVFAVIAYYAALRRCKGIENIPGPAVFPFLGNALNFTADLHGT